MISECGHPCIFGMHMWERYVKTVVILNSLIDIDSPDSSTKRISLESNASSASSVISPSKTVERKVSSPGTPPGAEPSTNGLPSCDSEVSFTIIGGQEYFFILFSFALTCLDSCLSGPYESMLESCMRSFLL